MNPWMEIAHNEALKGMDGNEGGPFGALIVREGAIISQAHNEVLKTNDPTAHAEMLVIREASQKLSTYDLSDCTLYTTCYPCPMCMGAIFWARIPTVYYGSSIEDAAQGGFDDARFYTMIRDPKSSLHLSPVDMDAGQTLFVRWLAKSNREMY